MTTSAATTPIFEQELATSRALLRAAEAQFRLGNTDGCMTLFGRAHDQLSAAARHVTTIQRKLRTVDPTILHPEEGRMYQSFVHAQERLEDFRVRMQEA